MGSLTDFFGGHGASSPDQVVQASPRPSRNLLLFFIDGASQAHIPLELFVLSVVATTVLFA
jgi:hypothetical protein